MKISIASDHAGFEQKQALVGYLASKGHDVIDRGPDCDEPLVCQEGCLICPACGFSRCG